MYPEMYSGCMSQLRHRLNSAPGPHSKARSEALGSKALELVNTAASSSTPMLAELRAHTLCALETNPALSRLLLLSMQDLPLSPSGRLGQHRIVRRAPGL